MIKIKFECWWTDSKSINNRIIKQFVDSKDLEEYNFVTENPDFTVILGRTDFEKIETKKEKTLYISQEPLWSPNEPKSGIEEYCHKILVADKSHYPDKPEYIETLLPMLYAGHGESDDREEWDWSYKMKEKKYKKNKIASVIVRKDYGGHFHSLSIPNKAEVNYEQRTKLTEKISLNPKIDVYGIHWSANDLNIKGEIWNKHVGLDEYMFSFSFENTIQKNYISEKFWDAILTNTIPLYIGCSNIKEYVPDNCFIYLNDLTQDEILKKLYFIIDNCDNLYNTYAENISKLKKDFYENSCYNLWERVKREINNV